MSNDLELEAFLRGFRPVPPAALPSPKRSYAMLGAGLAAGLACLALAAAWWTHKEHRAHPASPYAAARASLSDGPRLERLLDAESRRALADVGDQGGALSVLGATERDR